MPNKRKDDVWVNMFLQQLWCSVSIIAYRSLWLATEADKKIVVWEQAKNNAKGCKLCEILNLLFTKI